jgi:hypothetical protein
VHLDHERIRNIFKLLVAGYVLLTLLPFVPLVFGVKMAPGFAFAFTVFALLVVVIGLYLFWMLLNLVLDIHKKVEMLVDRQMGDSHQD